jgi:hypothetical protein
MRPTSSVIITTYCFVVLSISVGCLCSRALFSPRCVLEAPYDNPPENLEESDLVGTWEARYMEWGVDRLVLRSDGTFKQVFRKTYCHDCISETEWNEWRVERFPDGRVRLHLEGARYYPQPTVAGYWDPVADELVQPMLELVVNVRVDSAGNLLLLHMWPEADHGFAILGCEGDQFNRVDTP